MSGMAKQTGEDKVAGTMGLYCGTKRRKGRFVSQNMSYIDVRQNHYMIYNELT